MKTLFLAVLFVFSNSFASDLSSDISNISGTGAGDVITKSETQYDQLAMDNLSILVGSQKIKFMKNPCFGEKGLHFNSFRGFAFENGIVKKFKMDGSLSYDDNLSKKYDSLYSFLIKSKVCSSVSSKSKDFKINFSSLQIWN